MEPELPQNTTKTTVENADNQTVSLNIKFKLPSIWNIVGALLAIFVLYGLLKLTSFPWLTLLPVGLGVVLGDKKISKDLRDLLIGYLFGAGMVVVYIAISWVLLIILWE